MLFRADRHYGSQTILPPVPLRNAKPLTTETPLIGAYLVGDNAYASAAAYSMANKAMRKALQKTLHETVVRTSEKVRTGGLCEYPSLPRQGGRSSRRGFDTYQVSPIPRSLIQAGKVKLMDPLIGISFPRNPARPTSKRSSTRGEKIQQDPHFLSHLFPDLRLYVACQADSHVFRCSSGPRDSRGNTERRDAFVTTGVGPFPRKRNTSNQDYSIVKSTEGSSVRSRGRGTAIGTCDMVWL